MFACEVVVYCAFGVTSFVILVVMVVGTFWLFLLVVAVVFSLFGYIGRWFRVI